MGGRLAPAVEVVEAFEVFVGEVGVISRPASLR